MIEEASSRVIARQTRIYAHIKPSPLISLANEHGECDKRKREKETEKELLLYGEESSIVSSLPPFFLSPLREGYACGRFADGGTERRSAFIYVRSILILSYTGHAVRDVYAGRRMPKLLPVAAGVVARTEMDSGSKEREIRGGNVGEGERMEEEGVCVSPMM